MSSSEVQLGAEREDASSVKSKAPASPAADLDHGTPSPASEASDEGPETPVKAAPTDPAEYALRLGELARFPQNVRYEIWSYIKYDDEAYVTWHWKDGRWVWKQEVLDRNSTDDREGICCLSSAIREEYHAVDGPVPIMAINFQKDMLARYIKDWEKELLVNKNADVDKETTNLSVIEMQIWPVQGNGRFPLKRKHPSEVPDMRLDWEMHSMVAANLLFAFLSRFNYASEIEELYVAIIFETLDETVINNCLRFFIGVWPLLQCPCKINIDDVQPGSNSGKVDESLAERLQELEEERWSRMEASLYPESGSDDMSDASDSASDQDED